MDTFDQLDVFARLRTKIGIQAFSEWSSQEISLFLSTVHLEVLLESFAGMSIDGGMIIEDISQWTYQHFKEKTQVDSLLHYQKFLIIVHALMDNYHFFQAAAGCQEQIEEQRLGDIRNVFEKKNQNSPETAVEVIEKDLIHAAQIRKVSGNYKQNCVNEQNRLLMMLDQSVGRKHNDMHGSVPPRRMQTTAKQKIWVNDVIGQLNLGNCSLLWSTKDLLRFMAQLGFQSLLPLAEAWCLDGFIVELILPNFSTRQIELAFQCNTEEVHKFLWLSDALTALKHQRRQQVAEIEVRPRATVCSDKLLKRSQTEIREKQKILSTQESNLAIPQVPKLCIEAIRRYEGNDSCSCSSSSSCQHAHSYSNQAYASNKTSQQHSIKQNHCSLFFHPELSNINGKKSPNEKSDSKTKSHLFHTERLHSGMPQPGVWHKRSDDCLQIDEQKGVFFPPKKNSERKNRISITFKDAAAAMTASAQVHPPPSANTSQTSQMTGDGGYDVNASFEKDNYIQDTKAQQIFMLVADEDQNNPLFESQELVKRCPQINQENELASSLQPIAEAISESGEKQRDSQGNKDQDKRTNFYEGCSEFSESVLLLNPKQETKEKDNLLENNQNQNGQNGIENELNTQKAEENQMKESIQLSEFIGGDSQLLIEKKDSSQTDLQDSILLCQADSNFHEYALPKGNQTHKKPWKESGQLGNSNTSSQIENQQNSVKKRLFQNENENEPSQQEFSDSVILLPEKNNITQLVDSLILDNETNNLFQESVILTERKSMLIQKVEKQKQLQDKLQQNNEKFRDKMEINTDAAQNIRKRRQNDINDSSFESKIFNSSPTSVKNQALWVDGTNASNTSSVNQFQESIILDGIIDNKNNNNITNTSNCQNNNLQLNITNKVNNITPLKEQDQNDFGSILLTQNVQQNTEKFAYRESVTFFNPETPAGGDQGIQDKYFSQNQPQAQALQDSVLLDENYQQEENDAGFNTNPQGLRQTVVLKENGDINFNQSVILNNQLIYQQAQQQFQKQLLVDSSKRSLNGKDTGRKIPEFSQKINLAKSIQRYDGDMKAPFQSAKRYTLQGSSKQSLEYLKIMNSLKKKTPSLCFNPFEMTPLKRQNTLKIRIKSPDGSLFVDQVITTEGASMGRKEENTINFPKEQMISAQHAEIFFENFKFYLRDKGSKLGTFVKMQRIQLKNEMLLQLSISIEIRVVCLDVSQGLLQLEIRKHPASKKYAFKMKEGESILLGRDKERCHVEVKEQSISNVHAKIVFENGCFTIIDCDSLNGIWLRMSGKSEVSQPFLITTDLAFRLYLITIQVLHIHEPALLHSWNN